MRTKIDIEIVDELAGGKFEILGVFRLEETFFCRVKDVDSGVERKIFGIDERNAIDCATNFVLSLLLK